MCGCCKQKLIDAFLFKQKSQKSAKLLRKLLQVPDVEETGSAAIGKFIDKQTETCDVSTMTGSPRKSGQTDYSGSVENNLEVMFAGLGEENNEFLEVLVDDRSKNMIQFDADENQFHVTEKDVDDEEDIAVFQGKLETISDMQSGNCYLISELTTKEVDAADVVDVIDKMDVVNTVDAADFMDSENHLIEYALSDMDDDDPLEVIATKRRYEKGMKNMKASCSTCNVVIPVNDFGSHVADHEDFLPKVIGQTEFFRCNRCRRVYVSSAALFEHLKSVEQCALAGKDADPEYCTDYQFLDDSTLSISENLQMTSCSMVENLFTCDCGFATETFDELHNHYKAEHFFGPDELSQNGKDMCQLSHTCGTCEISFENVKEVVFHAYYHQHQFPCPVSPCSKAFLNSYNSLRRHIEREHIDGVVFSCHYCKQPFVGYDRLKLHMKTECKARRLTCKHCGKFSIADVDAQNSIYIYTIKLFYFRPKVLPKTDVDNTRAHTCQRKEIQMRILLEVIRTIE